MVFFQQQQQLNRGRRVEADGWWGGGGLQWDGRVQHVEERKKAEDGGMDGGERRGEEAWRGSRQLADFANPSFLSVKPSSEARGQSRASPYARLNAHFTGSAPIQPTGEPVDERVRFRTQPGPDLAATTRFLCPCRAPGVTMTTPPYITQCPPPR